MIFSTTEFAVFFAVVFSAHWLVLGLLPGVARMHARHLMLLAASYYFYMSWNPIMILLIVGSTTVDYLAGLGLGSERFARHRRGVLVVSIVTNLGILAVFKYSNFFLGNVGFVVERFGGTFDVSTDLVLPVGISFFTFQSMSYTIDVYRGSLQPTRNFVKFALYVAFFPQLVAGPIVRASHFLPQLMKDVFFNSGNFAFGMRIFALGLVKKVLLSDWVSQYSDQVFANPEAYGSATVWLGVTAYTIQIYCDFSGYSDMAIGAAAMMGYRLPENFNMPYLSSNVTEFWRRWHISLSTWLRDYLYIPVGGNRGGIFFTNRNLMITMLLGGLWHGASWTFVVWGALHGLALVVHREFRRWRPEKADAGTMRKVLGRVAGTVVTLVFVMYVWVFFRAQTFPDAMTIITRMTVPTGGESLGLPRSMWLPIIAVVLGHIAGVLYFKRIFTINENKRWWLPDAIVLMVAIAAAVLFGPTGGTQPFIYFQF